MKLLSPIRIAASASLFALSLFLLSATPARAFAGVANPDGAAAQEPAGFAPLAPTPPAGIPVDELDTYVFAVAPKTIEKKQHYFQGKVWVDQQDYQIVLINGMTVPQDTRRGHEDLQPPFTTYYEQVDGKYWFPTYTKAEGVLHFSFDAGGDVHMRNIVKFTDYKQYHTSSRII